MSFNITSNVLQALNTISNIKTAKILEDEKAVKGAQAQLDTAQKEYEGVQRKYSNYEKKNEDILNRVRKAYPRSNINSLDDVWNKTQMIGKYQKDAKTNYVGPGDPNKWLRQQRIDQQANLKAMESLKSEIQSKQDRLNQAQSYFEQIKNQKYGGKK